MKEKISSIIILICCFFVLLNAAACTQQTPSETGSDTQATVPNDTHKNDENSQSDSSVPQNSDVQESAPVIGAFRSFDELRSLIQAAKQGEEAFSALPDNFNLEFHEAQRIAEHTEPLSLPVLHSDTEGSLTIIEYYVYQDILSFIYDMGDTRYHFTYRFGRSVSSKDDPVAYTVTLDDLSVDLYPTDGGYSGSIAMGQDRFSVFVHFFGAEDETAITLDQFDLVPLFPDAE